VLECPSAIVEGEGEFVAQPCFDAGVCNAAIKIDVSAGWLLHRLVLLGSVASVPISVALLYLAARCAQCSDGGFQLFLLYQDVVGIEGGYGE